MSTPPQSKKSEFDLTSVHPSVVDAYKAVKAWTKAALSTTATPYWLTLYGTTGCGKTMLMERARTILKNSGKDAQLWPWVTVLRRLHNGEWELLAHLAKLPYLLLDDIGAEYIASNRAADFSLSQLYEVLENRKNRFTILTSNLTPDDFATTTTGCRIRSRLFRNNAQLCDLTQAADYCYTKHKNAGKETK